MYYKAFLDGQIVDALEEGKLQCVYYLPAIKRMLNYEGKPKSLLPQGIVSTNGQHIWQASVEGEEDKWNVFPEEALDQVDGTVVLVKIEEEEYRTLRELLDAGEQPVFPEEEPEPVPETDAETLAWAKNKKIGLSKAMLAAYLEANPIVSTAHNGEVGTYSVTEEKQQLMALNYNTYQIKKAAGLDAELTWNETGQECEVWTEAEYVQLIIEIEAYVKPLVSKQQSIEKQIQEATCLQEVDAVEISY